MPPHYHPILENNLKFPKHLQFPMFMHLHRLSLVAQTGKNSPVMWETQLWSLGWKIPWRRTWETTPVFLLGESPWTEEPGGLQSTESQRVRHNWATKHNTARLFTYISPHAKKALSCPTQLVGLSLTFKFIHIFIPWEAFSDLLSQMPVHVIPCHWGLPLSVLCSFISSINITKWLPDARYHAESCIPQK